MHHAYWHAFAGHDGHVALGVDDMENRFVRLPQNPETNQWLSVSANLFTIDTLTTPRPFFNNILKRLPAFANNNNNPTTFDNAKDTSLNLIR